MKLLRISGMIISCIFFVQLANAQSHPAISKAYSNEEIARMIKTYKNANSHDVMPSAMLQQRLQTDFPKAYDVEWETDGNIYEVEFNIQYKDYKAYYDAKGNLLMYVEEIYRSALPAIVKNAAENKYPKYSLEDMERIRRGTEVFYKIEMENNSSDMEVKLLIREDGIILEETFDY
jgi:L-2-hydroxyglutarate oxidase LhgO